MRALHSSAALAANVFDYWTAREKEPLWRALRIDNGKELLFEEEFDTGLPGTPPTLDLVAIKADTSCVAIESKFTEWLSRRPKNDVPFKPKYFDGTRQRWAELGLPKCQDLADQLRDGARTFVYLHAAQLLKHTLGVASRSHKNRVQLVYLFYDEAGEESTMHRSEVEAFGRAVAGEIDFSTITYQELFQRLRESCSDASEYLGYLADRYFPEAAPSSSGLKQ